MSKITIYFIRHGETYLNKYKRMQGWADTPLTKEGEEVARVTGKRLKDIMFDVVFSSDLLRTVRTAELILSENNFAEGMKIQPRKEFRETFFGYFEGATQGETYGCIAEHLKIPADKLFGTLSLEGLMDTTKIVDPTGDAENSEEFLERILKGMDNLLKEAKEKDYKTVLVVTHGNTIRNMVRQYDKTVNVFQEIGNSSVTTMEYENACIKVIGFNE